MPDSNCKEHRKINFPIYTNFSSRQAVVNSVEPDQKPQTAVSIVVYTVRHSSC